jgi:hypothetical protein
MKINLKLGQEQEPVQTGLRVRTLLQAGCGCETERSGRSVCYDDKEDIEIVFTPTQVKNWITAHCPKPIST